MYIFFVFALPTRTGTVSGGGAQVSLSRAVPTTANKLRPRATCERASTSVVRRPRSYSRVRWLRAGMLRCTVLRRFAHEGRVRPNATGLGMSSRVLKLTLDCCAICLMDGVSLGATALLEAGHPLTSRARAARHASVRSYCAGQLLHGP
jgi:hypothetical protein